MAAIVEAPLPTASTPPRPFAPLRPHDDGAALADAFMRRLARGASEVSGSARERQPARRVLPEPAPPPAPPPAAPAAPCSPPVRLPPRLQDALLRTAEREVQASATLVARSSSGGSPSPRRRTPLSTALQQPATHSPTVARGRRDAIDATAHLRFATPSPRSRGGACAGGAADGGHGGLLLAVTPLRPGGGDQEEPEAGGDDAGSVVSTWEASGGSAAGAGGARIGELEAVLERYTQRLRELVGVAKGGGGEAPLVGGCAQQQQQRHPEMSLTPPATPGRVPLQSEAPLRSPHPQHERIHIMTPWAALGTQLDGEEDAEARPRLAASLPLPTPAPRTPAAGMHSPAVSLLRVRAARVPDSSTPPAARARLDLSPRGGDALAYVPASRARATVR